MTNLVKEIIGKIELRNQKRSEKSKQYSEAESQRREKEQLLKEKEKEYNLTLDDNVLVEIRTLKDDIKKLQDQKSILSSSGILEGNFRYPYDKEEVIKELDNKLKNLDFESLKNNIVKTQEDYINSLVKYEAAIKSLLDERGSIKSVEEYIDIDTLRAVHNWFNSNYQALHISHDLKVGNTNNNVHNVEERLYNSISDKVNNLWGGHSYDFESLKNKQ